jgi:hypothetical protein
MAISLALIITYFISNYMSGETKFILVVGSLLSLSITLIGTVSASFNHETTTILTKTISGVFFVIILLVQIIFTVIENFLLPSYLLFAGGTTIMYILTLYGITRVKH